MEEKRTHADSTASDAATTTESAAEAAAPTGAASRQVEDSSRSPFLPAAPAKQSQAWPRDAAGDGTGNAAVRDRVVKAELVRETSAVAHDAPGERPAGTQLLLYLSLWGKM